MFGVSKAERDIKTKERQEELAEMERRVKFEADFHE